MTNVGRGDGGARLAIAKGVVLREACVRETTNKSSDNGGGARELLSKKWEERDGA